MGFSVSPGVNVTEVDLTTIVPAVSTTEGAVGGVFVWGPVEDRDLISSQDELRARFGPPTSDNYETWFTASNFLDYGNKLWVSRAASSNAYNSLAVSNTGQVAISNTQIKNAVDYGTKTFANTQVQFFSKYPGVLGDSLKISVCDSANAYVKAVSLGGANVVFTVGSNTAVVSATGNTVAAVDSFAVNDWIVAGNTTIGTQYLKISRIGTPVTANGITTAALTFTERYYLTQDYSETATVRRYWEYFNVVDGAPTTSVYADNRGGEGDELHIVVVDQDGKITGTPNQVLEVWQGLSRAKDAKGEQGGSIYYKDVLNQSSKYVWYANDRVGAASVNTADASVTATTDRAYTASFNGGADGATENTISLGDMIRAYNQFRAAEEVDVSLILTGKAVPTHGVRGMGLAKYLIENIAEYRKDAIVLVSPQLSDVVNNPFQEAESVVLTRNELGSSSYGVLDSGYKYQYDRYNDTYRWVPLNGDIGGLIVRTDETRDPWYSPGGFNRGNIKNVVKLAYNPDKGDRDLLYSNSINPVVTFTGEGTILYGDKTLQTKASAFDRINVRRLFIVLEKAISTAAKYTLFEFNDSFTRAQFRNLVEPYLRDVQGRRGIHDFKVVCDETNNTGQVIDANQFVGDIYIKPARSINFINLNFVAVRTGVDFNEVVGQF
jgi:phage tail sheath protein FI